MPSSITSSDTSDFLHLSTMFSHSSSFKDKKLAGTSRLDETCDGKDSSFKPVNRVSPDVISPTLKKNKMDFTSLFVSSADDETEKDMAKQLEESANDLHAMVEKTKKQLDSYLSDKKIKQIWEFSKDNPEETRKSGDLVDFYKGKILEVPDFYSSKVSEESGSSYKYKRKPELRKSKRFNNHSSLLNTDFQFEKTPVRERRAQDWYSTFNRNSKTLIPPSLPINTPLTCPRTNLKYLPDDLFETQSSYSSHKTDNDTSLGNLMDTLNVASDIKLIKELLLSTYTEIGSCCAREKEEQEHYYDSHRKSPYIRGTEQVPQYKFTEHPLACELDIKFIGKTPTELGFPLISSIESVLELSDFNLLLICKAYGFPFIGSSSLKTLRDFKDYQLEENVRTRLVRNLIKLYF